MIIVPPRVSFTPVRSGMSDDYYKERLKRNAEMILTADIAIAGMIGSPAALVVALPISWGVHWISSQFFAASTSASIAVVAAFATVTVTLSAIFAWVVMSHKKQYGPEGDK